MTLNKAALLKATLPEAVVSLPSAAGEVRVRGLSRSDAIRVSVQKSPEDQEATLVALGMVEPTLTVDDVREWQRVAPAGDLQAVSERIGELSGMTETSGKEAYKSA